MKRKFFRRTILLVFIVAASQHAWALKAFSAQYQASYKGVPANGAMSLTQQGARWTYSLSIGNSLASLSQATVFTEIDGKYRPLGSSDRSQYLTQRKSVVTRYDWSKLQVRWIGDVRPSRAGPVKMQCGDMDALLVNLALARDAPSGMAMNYRLVENGRAKLLNYKFAGRENMSIAGKSVLTTKVVQTSGDKQTMVWIALGIPVPVRIVQRQNGSEVFKLQIKSWR